MATFLSSGLLLAAVLQSPPPAPAPQAQDSAAGLWTRVAADSTDTQAWFDLGRMYVRRSAQYHRHTADSPDTMWARAVLDTADRAFARAAALAGTDAPGDSART